MLLLIAGEGPERGNIEAKIQELGIGQEVRLLGHCLESERFLASLDLNILPSVALETLGYSVVEAMFAGVPSVVSDVGGGKEIVGFSGGGAVVKSGNAQLLKEAICSYWLNPDRMRQNGLAARGYALNQLTARLMADQVLAAYSRIVG